MGRVLSRRTIVILPSLVRTWATLTPEGKRPEPASRRIAVELADVILRTLDLMAALGVDVDAVVMAKHRYNLGREYRHGGKRI